MTWRGPWDALTEADRDALAPYLGTDLRVIDIARELDWTTHKVYRVADKYGLSVRGRPKQVIRNIAAVVEDMRPLDAVEYLTEAYLNLSGECPTREAQLVADYGIPAGVAKVYAVMEAHAGEVVSLGALDMIFEQSGYDEADMRSRIHVEIYRARKEIARLGWPVRIENAYGMGYRLTYLEAA